MAEAEKATKIGWNRRDFLGGGTLLAMGLGIPAAVVSLSTLDAEDVPSERQQALMGEVAQHVIPATATKGADDVGVGAFVLLALAHGLENARAQLAPDAATAMQGFLRRDGSLDHAAWLEAELDRRAGSDYLKSAPDNRVSVLTALDAEAFAEGQNAHPWRTIKALILLGYYTSEEGGSRELGYEPIPGKWVPDMPMAPDARSYSSDWTAVEFG